MRKIISLAILLAVVALLLVTAVPALANGELPPGPPGKSYYSVGPTLGGPNNPHTHTPPGEPTVCIPMDNPAIGEDPLEPEPSEVFWPQP